MYPNRSKEVCTCPKALKTCKNVEKLRKNVKRFAKPANFLLSPEPCSRAAQKRHQLRGASVLFNPLGFCACSNSICTRTTQTATTMTMTRTTRQQRGQRWRERQERRERYSQRRRWCNKLFEMIDLVDTIDSVQKSSQIRSYPRNCSAVWNFSIRFFDVPVSVEALACKPSF